MSVDQLHKHLAINKDALEEGIINQPSLFWQVSEAYVQAAAERDAAKEELAQVDAEIDKKIRSKADKDEAKATEPYIKAQILLSEEHGDAFAAYLTAKERADKLQALKEAFQMRSYMLRDMASLYAANYFEISSLAATPDTDRAVYDRQRAKLAAARADKAK